MEVHHHAHTDSHRGKKKWTHYFWEFMMLFLAVFCGFLAENMRERVVENHRAYDYATNLYQDIQLDRDELKRGINQTYFMIDAIDSLVAIYKRIPPAGPVPGSFYYYARFATSTFRVDWSKSTIDQLIQSGNLRYFRSKMLVEDISFYYYMQGIVAEQNRMDMTHRDKIIDYRNRIFQSRYYEYFVPMDPRWVLKGKKYPGVDSLLKLRLPLQENSAELMDEFINHVLDRKARLLPIVERYYPIADTTASDIGEGLVHLYHLKIK